MGSGTNVEICATRWHRRRRARAGVRVPGRRPGRIARTGPRARPLPLRFRLPHRRRPAGDSPPQTHRAGEPGLHFPAPQRHPPPAPRPPKFLGHVPAPAASAESPSAQGEPGEGCREGSLCVHVAPASPDCERGIARPSRGPAGTWGNLSASPPGKGVGLGWTPAPLSGSLSDVRETKMLRRIGKGGRESCVLASSCESITR